MIQQLLEQIVATLWDNLDTVLNPPTQHIVLGQITVPDAEDLPIIAAYTGALMVNQKTREAAKVEPQPQQDRHHFAIDENTWNNPHTLPKTPLDGTLLCQVVFPDGQQQLMQEGADFIMNYAQAQLTFNTDISTATEIRVAYQYDGVAMLREFEQVFYLDIFATDFAELEQWAALATAMVLTNQTALLDNFNNLTNRTGHGHGAYFSEHSLSQIAFLEAIPTLSGSPLRMQLKFQANGLLKLIRAVSGGYGRIQYIISPNKTVAEDAEPFVDIDIVKA